MILRLPLLIKVAVSPKSPTSYMLHWFDSVASGVKRPVLQFLTRPFVVGDRIELKTTSGGTVLIGVVEKIDPMRTVLRTDGTVPVAVPNKAITDMIVSNESRLGRSEVVTEFKVDPFYFFLLT